jgi:hypothetical protein
MEEEEDVLGRFAEIHIMANQADENVSTDKRQPTLQRFDKSDRAQSRTMRVSAPDLLFGCRKAAHRLNQAVRAFCTMYLTKWLRDFSSVIAPAGWIRQPDAAVGFSNVMI